MGKIERLKESCWPALHAFSAWILILIEAIIKMISDTMMNAWYLEPLRIFCLFIITAVFFVFLMLYGHPKISNIQSTSKRRTDIMIFVFLAVWTIINLEVTLQWKRKVNLADINLSFSILVQIVKQLAITFGFYHLITNRVLKLLALSSPAFYYLFRCEFYAISIIESVILILFPLLSAIILIEHANPKPLLQKPPSELKQERSLIFNGKALVKQRSSMKIEKSSPLNIDPSDKQQSKIDSNVDPRDKFKNFPKEMILDKLPDGIALTNSNGKFEYFNDSIATILNCPKAEAIDLLLSLPNKSLAENTGKQNFVTNIRKTSTLDTIRNKGTKTLTSLTFLDPEPRDFSTPKSPPQKVSVNKRVDKENKTDISKKLESKTLFLSSKFKEMSPIIKGIVGNREKQALCVSDKEISDISQRFTPNKHRLKHLLEFKKQNNDVMSEPENINEDNSRLNQDRIDKYFENIFNDVEESDRRDVRGTVNHVLQLLIDLRDSIIENANDQSEVARKAMKFRMRYSATGISGDRFFRKFTMCSSFAVRVESCIILEDGKVRSLEILINPMIIEGDAYILMQLRDVSSTEEVKRLKEVNRQKNSSLASIIHEFRSPLNGVLSMLEVAKPLVVPELRDKYLHPAHTSASALLYLVNDILDLHQMQAKELRLVFSYCNLAEICENALNMMKFKADQRGLELELFLDSSLPPFIYTDPNRLQQIIVNLLSNAVKFTERGKISIQGTYLTKGKIKLQVSDTGIGIEPENLQKLFKSFGKIDLGGKNYLNPQGAGLGLFISHGLAKRLNFSKSEGGLSVTSEVGKGTCFSFIIDDKKKESENLELIDEVESKQMAKMLNGINKNSSTRRNLDAIRKLDGEPGSMIKASTSSPNMLKFAPEKLERLRKCNCSKILVADDDEINIWALKSQLETLNFQTVDSARNGEEAVKKFIERASQRLNCCRYGYVLILMDCEMPIKNGILATKEIKQYAKDCRYPAPIVVGVSGHSSADVMRKCMDAGMDNMITKPVTIKTLKEILKSINLL